MYSYIAIDLRFVFIVIVFQHSKVVNDPMAELGLRTLSKSGVIRGFQSKNGTFLSQSSTPLNIERTNALSHSTQIKNDNSNCRGIFSTTSCGTDYSKLSRVSPKALGRGPSLASNFISPKALGRCHSLASNLISQKTFASNCRNFSSAPNCYMPYLDSSWGNTNREIVPTDFVKDGVIEGKERFGETRQYWAPFD